MTEMSGMLLIAFSGLMKINIFLEDEVLLL